MMLAKINLGWTAVPLLALALMLTGCTPAGPRALLNGKKALDRGEITTAVAELKTATSLLATNAQAWNYYGVALQSAGQPEEAVKAYQQALELNRDLLEARFNLGCLWLEQNKPAEARAEFTTLTKLRPNDVAGWLKLGSAQLRLGEYIPAERSFSTVLALKPADAEAYNGVGLAFVQRGRYRDAAQYFAAATRSDPQLAAAYLNLANVSQQYLRDNKTALENYRAYLQLNPRPANWEVVSVLAASLEQPTQLAAAPTAPVAKAAPPVAPPATPQAAPATAAPEPKPQPKPTAPVVAPRSPAPARPQPVETVREPEARPTVTRPLVVAAKPAPAQVVQVAPAPQIVTTPPPAAPAPVAKPAVVTAPVEPVAMEELPEPEKKPGFWRRMFNSDRTASAPAPQSLEKKLTPLPPPADETAVVERPAAPPAPPTFPRYNFVSPHKPAPGNRTAASGAFTRAQVFEQGEKWIEALQWYQQAAEFDPAWFEAQYNTAVLAQRLRNYSVALPRYENALAIQPDSVDTRYNLALCLKGAGYATDAANELKKIIASRPDDVRAHLALGNLAVQPLRDHALARRHYLKVLELAPDHPQAADIRFWLSSNPP